MAYVQSVKDGQLVDTSASATSESTSKTKNGNTLGQQDFLELLVAKCSIRIRSNRSLIPIILHSLLPLHRYRISKKCRALLKTCREIS